MSFTLTNNHYHFTATGQYFQNLYNASKPGANIKVGWVEAVPDEATWDGLAKEAEALLNE
jgi:hypothetical protein